MDRDKNFGECGVKGNPCNPATGNKHQAEEDYRSGDGSLTYTRHYNSQAGTSADSGFNWSAAPRKRLDIAGEIVRVRQANGRAERFTCAGGACQGDADTKLTLTQDASGYTLTTKDGAEERYDTVGRLLGETDSAGRPMSYAYDTRGQLSSVTSPFGHSLTIAYSSGRISKITDPSGQEITYSYDANTNNLTKVAYPDGTAKLYHYENPAFPKHLTGISYVEADGTTTRYATYAYDTSGRAISTEHAGGVQHFGFSYDSDTQTTVTDAAGTPEVMTFATNLGVKNLVSQVNQGDGKTLARVFDAGNNLTCRRDEEGRVTTYTYSATNQKTSMTEGLGGDCATPTATSASRTTVYQYASPALDLPTVIQSPSVHSGQSKTVTIEYGDGAHPNLPTSIVQSGYMPTGATVSRTVTLSYNDAGQVSAIDGPRSDVSDLTTLAYYDCLTGGGCGQLRAVTNALGQVTTFDSYDANGRLLQTTDPNGLVTSYVYDARGRVTQITQTPPGGTGRVTQYTYNAAGDVTSVAFPDGRSLTYTYNAARLLTRVMDNLGNHVSYGYDARGNRTQEYTYDASNTLVRSIDTAYDLRNRVSQINAAGSITQLVNDAVGNLTGETNPNGNPTVHGYDALNRLIQTVDALSGVTGYSYDLNDRIQQVTAPNSATTQYLYDDLGNLLQEISPDRGTLSYAYDSAGNLKTVTDARGITASYTYDALNRITATDYPGTHEDVAFIYDSCANGVGRLCRVQDQSGTTDHAYDPFGNITQQVKTELGVSYATAYTYDAGDRLITMTYPDGRVVAYARDALGRISQVSTTSDETTTIIDNITYRADGLVTGQTFGNGLGETREYDQQGRLLTQFLGSADTRLYGYDANGNLITKQSLPEVASYTYDPLDRLTAETRTNGTVENVGYAYDPNGNRLRANAESYAYMPSTNRLSAIDASPVALDATGNTLSDAAGRSFSYNAAGRLAQVVKAGAILGTYTYNFQGQRTRKVNSTGTTVYHYDLAGNLIAETNAQGEPIKQYLWANGVPVAVFGRGLDPGIFTFSGSDPQSGSSATVGVNTQTQTLSVNETGGVSGEFQPDSWQLDEATQTLTLSHRTDEGVQLQGTFALGATPPSGTLAIGTTPRQARYRFPSQPAGVLTGSDPSTGGTATLALDPPNRAVTLQKQGPSRTVTIPAGNWFSLGFGNTRFTLFRFAEEGFSLFGFVFAQGGSAQGYVALTDGVARETRYALTGEAATTAAQFVYLHTDPLGTPRLATDSAQTVLWRWEGEAFGKSTPNEDPDGDGIKTPINLRFPGQYHDAESGLYYNWHRYYDPRTGRYITSDPIGLRGGLNPFTYVNNNPLRWIDPTGLYDIVPGIPLPQPRLNDLLNCIDSCLDSIFSFTVTSTYRPGPNQGAHGSGEAADIRYRGPLTVTFSPDKFLCCAASCGAGYAQDEYSNPSAGADAPHLHIQLPRGRRGGRGDLPLLPFPGCDPNQCGQGGR